MNCSNCNKEIKEGANFCSACGTEAVNNPGGAVKVLGETDERSQLERSKYNKARLLWILVPIASMFVLAILWGIVSFLEEVAPSLRVLVELFNVFVPIFFALALIFIPIGIVVAIRITNKIKRLGVEYDSRSGKGDASIVPDEVKKGLNWGPGLGIIWGAYFNIWSSLLVLIPLVNLIWFIVALVEGNEWMWRNNKWVSVEEFQDSRRRWNIAGATVLIISLSPYLLVILIALASA
ncbi:MAG: zinc-ribbon domain-containing protein [Candidatus Paceibacterota bacterium]